VSTNNAVLEAETTAPVPRRLGLVDDRQSATPVDLLELAQELGRGTGRWDRMGAERPTERTYHLLQRDADVEAWLIAWPTGGHLELHDHGQSNGAFWVVDGRLEELYAHQRGATSSFGHRRHWAGSGVGFGPGYLHDVRNADVAPALSVHVYSPPLESMTFFSMEQAGAVPARLEERSSATWEH